MTKKLTYYKSSRPYAFKKGDTLRGAAFDSFVRDLYGKFTASSVAAAWTILHEPISKNVVIGRARRLGLQKPKMAA